MLCEYEFHNRKPSIKQINACINNALKDNASMILISWGENRIDIERSYNNQYWTGSGWIKNISGYDIAKGLNHA
jgi:hypothetical protein